MAAMVERARGRGEVRADADAAAFADLFSGCLWVRLLTGRIDDDAQEIAKRGAHHSARDRGSGA